MTSRGCFAAAVLLLLGAATVDGAEGVTHLAIAPRSTIFLNGSSNVASWRCTGTAVEGAMTVAAPISKINAVIDHVEDGNIGAWMTHPGEGHFPEPEMTITIAIDTLRCSGGHPMEQDMKRALKADRFPAIVFHFDGLRSGISHDIDRHEFGATVSGGLSLAGVTRNTSFPVTAQRMSSKLFRMTAEMPVRMTEFGVTPPRALFGMIKAADGLSVHFELLLEAVP